MPQAAWRLDPDTARRGADELILDVDLLNIDAASFVQLDEASGGDPERIGQLIQQTVAARGKQHNPVTGSGGMLLGRVAWVGDDHPARPCLRVGASVATLASLTLTPLALERIIAVHRRTHQVEVVGRAVVFASAPCVELPAELPRGVVLAILDVAGAAPQVARRVSPGQVVLVLGAGGKSGLLVSRAARNAGATVVGIEAAPAAAAAARRLGACHHLFELDAREPLAAALALERELGRLADLAVSCVSVANAEMAAILATRCRGTVYFFSMATSFTQAALGAEGVGADVELVIGNGYCQGHAEFTLELVRADAPLRALLTERYG
jgi:L-erythro-3,5-diaminohexanoate dehydrogenase